MEIPAIILGLAALGGLTMAVMRFRGIPHPPTWLALGHGAIAATGLGLLAYQAVNPGIPGMAQIALAVFVAAALGGIAMFALYHLKNLPLPIPFVLGHGIIALTGFALLLASIYGA